jgi:CRISPR system Cascade subunit CasA
VTSPKTLLSIAVLLLALTACAHYEARPVELSALAKSQATRTLDTNTVMAMRSRIAPETRPEVEQDRLWLLAAILSHNPKVASAKATIATAEVQAKAERHIASPTLTLTGEYANDPATKSPWLIGGAVDLPLDMRGRRSARLRSADLAVLIARYDFAEVVWAERMAARRALIDHFIAERRIATDLEMLSLRDRQLAAAGRRLKSGAASNVELEQVRIAREAAARDLAQAQGQSVQSSVAIASILGLPANAIDQNHWIWADFEAAPAPDGVDQGARIAAVTGRADVLKALADYDRADAAYRGEIAKQVPALTLSPGYTWERGLVKLPLSVGLSLPPLDLNHHAIVAAKQAREEAGKKLEVVVAAANGAIDAALAERDHAWEALRALREHDLPVAQAAARRADDRLRLGGIDRVIWADAQGALLDARGRELDALARLHVAEAALEDALREPLEGPETGMTVSALEAMK